MDRPETRWFPKTVNELALIVEFSEKNWVLWTDFVCAKVSIVSFFLYFRNYRNYNVCPAGCRGYVDKLTFSRFVEKNTILSELLPHLGIIIFPFGFVALKSLFPHFAHRKKFRLTLIVTSVGHISFCFIHQYSNDTLVAFRVYPLLHLFYGMSFV